LFDEERNPVDRNDPFGGNNPTGKPNRPSGRPLDTPGNDKNPSGNGLKTGKDKTTLKYQLPSADMLRIGLALHLENVQSDAQTYSNPQATASSPSPLQIAIGILQGLGSQVGSWIQGGVQGAGDFFQWVGDGFQGAWQNFSDFFNTRPAPNYCTCGPDDFPGRVPNEEEDPDPFDF
jgi:hypothetical protein